MSNEISELEKHGTWKVIKKTDIQEVEYEEGNKKKPKIIPTTWAFRIKRFPSGLMQKIKARFCVRGDLQDEGDYVDVFDTYAPVAAWHSIRMMTILSLQKKWVTKQIDFSNAFVQAPLNKSVYVQLPSMFVDTSGIALTELCLELKKSLYGMREDSKH